MTKSNAMHATVEEAERHVNLYSNTIATTLIRTVKMKNGAIARSKYSLFTLKVIKKHLTMVPITLISHGTARQVVRIEVRETLSISPLNTRKYVLATVAPKHVNTVNRC